VPCFFACRLKLLDCNYMLKTVVVARESSEGVTGDEMGLERELCIRLKAAIKASRQGVTTDDEAEERLVERLRACRSRRRPAASPK
jgi:hypothetical protein